MAEFKGDAQHPVISDQERKLDQHGQTAAGGIYAFLLIERADLFVHGRFARIAEAVLFVLFLDGLDLGGDALHLEHRLHLRNAQGQQQDGDDESLDNDGPSPVVDDMVVGPLEPEEERARQDAPPAEVDDAAEVRAVVLDGGDGDGVEYSELFGADIHALGGWALKAANGGAQDINVGSVFGARADGVEAGRLRDVHGIAQGHHGNRLGIVGDKDGGEVLIAGARPLEWALYRVATADTLDGETRNIVREEDVAAALGRSIVVVVDAGGAVGCSIVLAGPRWNW